MKAIIAVNNLGYIGLYGELPWKFKEDLKHFKKLTMGQKLLVGYRTAQTLPNLPGRTLFVDGIDEFNPAEIDWCIGGAATYEKYCHLFTELHISVIDDMTEGDTLVPPMSRLDDTCLIHVYHFTPDAQ